jgi:hypothetical protein
MNSEAHILNALSCLDHLDFSDIVCPEQLV